MKKNLPVTDNEIELTNSDVIISATDLKGAITSTNETFKEISGFSDDELLAKNKSDAQYRYRQLTRMAAADYSDEIQ